MEKGIDENKEKEKINDINRFTERMGGGGYNFALPDPFNSEDEKEVNICLTALNWYVNSTKKLYDFNIPVKEKDKFKNWIKILSGPEFLVTVDYDKCLFRQNSNHKWEKLFSTSDYRTEVDDNEQGFGMVRIAISGDEVNINRWLDNIQLIVKFLNNDYDIEYLNIKEKLNNATIRSRFQRTQIYQNARKISYEL